MDFWVEVFKTWRTDQLVFHDRSYPARVYSVKTSKYSCSQSARSVEAERDRVEGLLRTVAKKVTWEKPGWTGEERAFLALFPDKDPDEISGAANRVRCQQGNRDRFEKALKRYGRYKGHILQTLREHGLSEDILYLPFVESAYNPEAYSRAGAAGLWQIMPATARKLGLQLDATMDERFDPRRATWAAAKYLRHSTDVLTEVASEINGSVRLSQVNPFVITSYNYGVTGMSRALRSVGTDYIEVLDKYRSRSFRTAVRNFYSSFLAARYVARNAEKYFGPLKTDGELSVTQVALKKPTSVDRIVKVFGVHRDTVERLNPALTRYVWKGWRLIPEGYTLNIPYRSSGWDGQIAKLESLPAEQPQLSGRQYVVGRGDTACAIARAFAVKCRDLIQLNGLGRRALIRVGQKLDIPGQPKRTPSQRVAEAENGRYTVRRGDTACEIARSFKVNCRELIRVNGLGKRAIIHIGQQLRVPGLEKSTQVAEAENGRYTVRRGDTACEVARSFKVNCRELIRANGLGKRAIIHIGQQLRIPGLEKFTQVASSQPAVEAENGRYTVRGGDTACEVARSFKVNCRELIRVNGLGRRAVIHIGQKLRIPGLEKPTQVARADDEDEPAAPEKPASDGAAESATEEPPAEAQSEPIPELMDEISVAVRVEERDGKTRYSTEVLPEETLGHYADWLGLGGTGKLREMNGIEHGQDLRSGRRIQLPISDDSRRLAFEASRFEFHQTLVDEFNQHYEVTGVKDYTVKLGDTLWKIADRHNVPYWFLRRANSSVHNPVIGQSVRVPELEARHESRQPMVE